MAFGFFGKGKNKEPEKDSWSIRGYQLFKYPTDAGAFAATITDHWIFQGVWANGGDPNADEDAIMELMELAGDEDFPYDYYVVQEATGSLGVLNADIDDDTEEIEEDEIEWVALAGR